MPSPPANAPASGASLGQEGRALRITTPNNTPFIVTGFDGVESLSQPFRFEVELYSGYDTIDFADVLGQAATLTAEIPERENSERHWNGLITQLAQVGQDQDFVYYSAVLEPDLAQLTLQSDCRVFQDITIDDLIDEVLSGIATRKAYCHDSQRKPHSYRVQYRESDFAFFSRLMEEAGLFYFFEHTEDSHTLVLCDDSTQLEDTQGVTPIDFHPLDGGAIERHAVKEWSKTQRLVGTQVVCRDTHFQKPRYHFEAKEAVVESFKVGETTHKPSPVGTKHDNFLFPGGYAARYDEVPTAGPGGGAAGSAMDNIVDDATTEARLQCEWLAAEAIRVRAKSDALPLMAGGYFTLKGHADANGKYLVRSVRHAAKIDAGNVTRQPVYHNSLECQPADLPYRPTRSTPKPVISGVQTAMVVADLTANESDLSTTVQQFYDQYGRVKVWFPWDRRPESAAGGGSADGAGAAPANRSCWVRVAQVWAGQGWGAFFWPRHGHEVLVAFEHGDPDRPVVVGSVYNAKNMPPMEMPTHQALAGFKSCSVNGNPVTDFNGITFHDTMDNEHLEIHSEAHTIHHNEQSEHKTVLGSSVNVSGTLVGALK